jgi:hypothetical protein
VKLELVVFYFDLDLQTTDDNEVETLLEIDKEDIVVDPLLFTVMIV